MHLLYNRCLIAGSYYYSGRKENNRIKHLKEELTFKGVSNGIVHINNAPHPKNIFLSFCHVVKYYQ